MTVVPLARPPTNLDDLAHEINVRLQKVDDHRLSASIKLAEAKVACKEQGIPFKQWVAKEIKGIGYPEATKLAKIGAAKDPAKALADHRQKTKATKDAAVQKKVAYVGNSPAPAIAPSRGKDAIIARVRDAITALSGLPPAAEVVGYFAGTDEGVLIGERLPAAVRWLSEFADNWPEESDA